MTRGILSAIMLAAVALLAATGSFAQSKAKAGVNAEHLRRFETDIFGPSVEAAVKQAALHAVRSAVGEFYCSDEMLLGRALLERYLDKSYERFIASTAILSKRESQGMTYMRVSVVVDVKALEDDLRQKRFFYKPLRRPIFYVTLSETVDGAPTSGEPVTRGAIHDALSHLLIRYEPRVIYSQAANIDLTQDARQMIEAREAAERAGSEVLLTGSAELRRTEQKKINFDDYTFYSCRLTLTLVRVDDGKVLGSGSYEAIAGNVNGDTAKRVAADRAAAKILESLIPGFSERWEKTMTDLVDLQVMVTGVNEQQANVIEDRLATRLPGAEVYRRSFFEDVVVFNLASKDKSRPVSRQEVEKVLRELSTPRLIVMPAKVEKHVHAKRTL
ncbi:MAG: hypothetical protein N3D11_00855 [Candidatus Sumerlaeia bacterium]|nr:hypothetical protein [Candidatus Sumerlaeia bacterium]